jgi:hypothetical protein
VSSSGIDIEGTFRAVVEVMRESQLRYAFIGALPVLAWGRVRATTDVDLVVAVGTEWWRLASAFARRGFASIRQVGPADSADALPDIAMFRSGSGAGTRVDLFVAKTEFEAAVIDSARSMDVLGVRVQLASPEASIVYKLLARRPRDIDDVESIFEARAAANDALDWSFLDQWAGEWGIADRLAPYRARYRR